VPTEYYCGIDETTGERKDVNERPELRRGIVEVVATQEYTTRTPQTPSYVFVIDVG
jgi:protein transport protein SEC24